MKFYKYHGSGNDFICFDNRNKNIDLTPHQVIKMCDRHFGIGADGVIIMTPSEEGADIYMDYRNADGMMAEMCGNGVRVAARFAREYWQKEKSEILVNTRSGIKSVRIFPNYQYQVCMGAPVFHHADFPLEPYTYQGVEWYFVSMGNPHMIAFFENQASGHIYLKEHAQHLEGDTTRFPRKINVSGVWKKSETIFEMQTFERGCGFTLACGTAASAAFCRIAQYFPELRNQKIQIDIPGGTLFFEYSTNREILMTGPAEKVFEGDIPLY